MTETCSFFKANTSAKVSMVPSPPSPIGSRSKVASGRASLKPFSRASATCFADKDSLNESGAKRMCISCPSYAGL